MKDREVFKMFVCVLLVKRSSKASKEFNMVKQNQSLQAFVTWMWCLAFVSATSVLYILDPVNIKYGLKEYPSLAMSILYNAFHRVAWTFALGWVIFACFHGYGGDCKLQM